MEVMKAMAIAIAKVQRLQDVNHLPPKESVAKNQPPPMIVMMRKGKLKMNVYFIPIFR